MKLGSFDPEREGISMASFPIYSVASASMECWKGQNHHFKTREGNFWGWQALQTEGPNGAHLFHFHICLSITLMLIVTCSSCI